jgi:DNA-directed RNA polymerase specialized sigma24 family protein
MSKPRQLIDHSELTEYEQKIHDLRLSGLSWKEVGEAMGQKLESVRSRYPIIRDKLALQEAQKKAENE